MKKIRIISALSTIFKIFSVFNGFITLLAASVAIAAWPLLDWLGNPSNLGADPDGWSFGVGEWGKVITALQPLLAPATRVQLILYFVSGALACGIITAIWWVFARILQNASNLQAFRSMSFNSLKTLSWLLSLSYFLDLVEHFSFRSLAGTFANILLDIGHVAPEMSGQFSSQLITHLITNGHSVDLFVPNLMGSMKLVMLIFVFLELNTMRRGAGLAAEVDKLQSDISLTI